MRVSKIAFMSFGLAVILVGCADESDTDLGDGEDTAGDGDVDADADGDSEIVFDWSGCQLGNYNADLTIDSLDDFDVVVGHRGVRGDLVIENGIGDLTKLSCIESVEGNLTISANPSLESLEGLNGLVSVTGTLTIRENEALVNLDALGALESVGGLVILNNTALTGLEGLSSLAVVEEILEIRSNAEVPGCEICDLGNQLDEIPPDSIADDNLFDGCTPVVLPCDRPS